MTVNQWQLNLTTSLFNSKHNQYEKTNIKNKLQIIFKTCNYKISTTLSCKRRRNRKSK